MATKLPGPLCVRGAALNLDVIEVRHQVLALIAADPGALDVGDKLEAATLLLAVELALNALLNSQAELQSRPKGERP